MVEHAIAYTVRVSTRARRMRISITHEGAVVVTLPRRVPLMFAERFVREKSRWIAERLRAFERTPSWARQPSTAKDLKVHQAAALALAAQRLAHFNSVYHYTFNRVSIRNQKTRWGSCSQTGNITFNYKIVFLPPHLVDYIVVHELCHLREMNHSKRFWDLVAQVLPNHRELRRELRGGSVRVG